MRVHVYSALQEKLNDVEVPILRSNVQKRVSVRVDGIDVKLWLNGFFLLFLLRFEISCEIKVFMLWAGWKINARTAWDGLMGRGVAK